MEDDRFICAIDKETTAEVIDNGDGRHIMVSIWGDDGNGSAHGYMGIALTAADADRMAEVLLTLAAGLRRTTYNTI